MARSPLRTSRRTGLFSPIAGRWQRNYPLQAVASRGEMSNATYPSGLRHVGRSRHYFGGKAKTIALVDGNWLATATGEANGTYAFGLKRAIEINGVTVPCTYAGQTSITLQPGDTVTTDEIPASAFGLSYFDTDTVLWARYQRDRSSSQNFVIHGSGSAYSTLITGENAAYRSDGVDVTQVNDTGAIATGGATGWTSSFGAVQWFPLALIGRPFAPFDAWFIAGASKEYGQSDSAGDGSNDGGGYVRRAFQDIDNHHVAHTMAVASGEGASNFIDTGSTKRRALLPYFNKVLCGHGGNDYSNGVSIANAITRIETEWSQLKGTRALHMVLEMPKTNSTDSWATTANQTPRTNYATGGSWRDAFNANIAAAVGEGLITAVVNLNGTVADGTAVDKWKASSTTDGTHPNKATQGALATAFTAYLEGL